MSEVLPTALLLARSAIAAVPLAEMTRLAALLEAQGNVAAARFAFSEQGEPSLRGELLRLVEEGAASVVIVPLMLPAEPSFTAWLGRAIARWRREDGRRWPEIRVAPPLGGLPGIALLLDSALRTGADAPVEPPPPAKAREGSVVPPQKRRVLVCHGGPCTAAGAALVWGHLRNEQARLSLRTEGEGMMSAKTTCLGPCNLAPVVQVWPENTCYGGVDEAAVDAIVGSHILGGGEALDHAYPADGKKQFLRPR
ncbi:MAG TPA: (2Fe-2S) ferredoxin domain-containing protein [Novosphingobium sp.]|nr:(2Fe-2S) ferredoxin domain-containing protein [Novosphingobium sp.]